MENTEIISLWKSYSKKLDENLMLNRKNATDITLMKVASLLSSMMPLKIFTILAGIIWVGFLDILIVNLFSTATPFFLISAGIQSLLTTIAIGIYLYQIILIQQADISEPVLATQNKLARLKSTTIWVTRLLFLQLPVWTTFYWNKSMLENGNIVLYILQIAITLLFTFMAIWLFKNIKYENRNKQWFGLIFNGKEWNPVIKSIEMLGQVAAYRDDKM